MSQDKAASFLWQVVIPMKPQKGRKRKATKQTQPGNDDVEGDEGDLGDEAMDSATGVLNASGFIAGVERYRF